MLRKTRSDASWNKLSKAQRELLEGWLFEEGLGYEEALTRAKTELGYEGSVYGLKRFYRRCAQERLLREMVESVEEAQEVCSAAVDVSLLAEASRRVLGQRFFARLRTEEIADTAELGRLWVQAEANEVRRQRLEVQRAAQAVRKQRLEFEREQWQEDLVAQVEEMLPEMMELEEERIEEEDPYFENKRVNAIRKNLFGPDIPELAPESAEEEAAMIARGHKWAGKGA